MKKINFKGLMSLFKIPKFNFKRPASKSFKRPSNLDNFTNYLEWDSIINALFSPERRPWIHKLFMISMVCALAYTSGKIATLGIIGLMPDSKNKNATTQAAQVPMPSSSRNDGKNMLTTIQSANLFNTPIDSDNQSQKVVAKQDNFAQKKCLSASSSSSLPITLLSTTVMQDSVKSIASVQVRSKADPLGLREGDIVSGMAEVGKIDRLKIIIKNLQSGNCEYVINKETGFSDSRNSLTVVSPEKGKALMAQHSMDGITNVGNHFEISKQKRDELLNDLGSILTQARGIPIQNSDGSMSFKITDVVPGGLIAHWNIQDEDMITSINGKPIQNMAELMDMFSRIKDIDKLVLGISRDGADITQDYSFK